MIFIWSCDRCGTRVFTHTYFSFPLSHPSPLHISHNPKIDELKRLLDGTREQLRKAEGDVEAQRRERDRLKGQLTEAKTQVAMSQQQAEEKSAERDAAKSEATEYSILLERAKVLEVSARDEIMNQTKVRASAALQG